jgi:hypothetical protein
VARWRDIRGRRSSCDTNIVIVVRIQSLTLVSASHEVDKKRCVLDVQSFIVKGSTKGIGLVSSIWALIGNLPAAN